MQAEDETKVVERELNDSESDDAAAGSPEVSEPAGDQEAGELPAAQAPTNEQESVPPSELETPAPGDAEPARPSGARGSSSGMDLLASHRLVGRYEMIHRLGHGGMATVYLGRAIGTAGFERLVAVKVIHPHLASEPEFVEMFLDEARIAAKIHHPHVVEIIDLGEDDELFFMVMEYVEGENLAALLRELRKRKEQLALPAALQVVSDVCRGLSAAHELKDHGGNELELVHRDVSPHNFLISMDGRVRVVDFGIMKAAGKRSTTLTGQLRGKVPYMSPEQAKAKSVDLRTDIFALGAVLWEMLAGERLFSGETESETLAKVVQCQVPDVFELRPDLPESLRPILEKSLAPAPGDRYSSASEMLKDIRAALRQLDEDDPRDVLAGYMRRFFQTRIDYIHATIRGHAANDQGAARSAGSMADLSFSKSTPAGPAVSAFGRLTPSNPPLVPQTLTTSIGSPARQWTLWLLLPLAGAVIGTMVVRTWDREDNADVQRSAPAAEATPANTHSPLESSSAEADPSLETVKWWFNTYPQGATISIDGVAQTDVTPTAIELPRGDDPVIVRIEKEGFKTRVLELAPLGNENQSLQLEPLEPTPAAVPETKSGQPWLTARPPKSKKSAKPKASKASKDAAPEPSASDTGSKPSSDEPQLPDVPDFSVLKKKKPAP